MASFLQSSIGQKLLMSLTGLFLIVFLVVHLVVNATMLFDNTGILYNEAAHFMATNPVIKVVEPLLAIGFIIHIIYSLMLTIQNLKARPQGYKSVNQSKSSKWSSRNMLILGGLVFTFLVIHIINFYWKMKVTGEGIATVQVGETEMHDAYTLVSNLFAQWWYMAIYVVGAVFLGLHLNHAFWSAFQTLGLSNILWRKRLDVLGLVYTLVVAGGFAFIALFSFIKATL